MDRLVQTTLSGLRATLEAQRVTANNIANASTIGFRRDDADFAARYLGGPTLASRAQSADSVAVVSGQPGALTATGNPLDVAIAGDAWLAVQAPDGGEAYTRRGDLRPRADGVLTTGDGLTVVGDAGPITLPPGAARPEIAADGTISFQPAGGSATERAVAGRLKLATPVPGDLRRGGDGLLRPQGSTLPADTNARLVSGHLEQSNVSPVAEMVDLMERARAFELQVKMVSGARDMDQSAAQLMRMER